jgi:hypothetical protein
MSAQVSIFDSIAAGQQASEACTAKAIRKDPLFAQKAEAAILNHLRIVGHCSGEVLTDLAEAMGAVPHDGRAFGSVFRNLARKGLIVCLRSDLPRKNGHGTSGGKLWGLVQ